MTVIVTAVAATGGAAFLVLRSDRAPLSLHFEAGTSRSYELTVEDRSDPALGSPDGVVFRLSATLAARVDGVAGETALVDVTITDLELGINDDPMVPLVIQGVQSIHVDTSGRQQELILAAADAQGVLAYLLDPIYPALPTEEVGAGETWPLELSVGLVQGDGDTNYRGEGKLLRFDALDGVRAAVVSNTLEYDYDETIDAASVAELASVAAGASGTLHSSATGSYTLTAWIDAETGSLLKAEGTNVYDVRARYEGYPEGLSLPAEEVHVSGTATVTLALRS